MKQNVHGIFLQSWLVGNNGVLKGGGGGGDQLFFPPEIFFGISKEKIQKK